jgi:predicted outer membrane protein
MISPVALVLLLAAQSPDQTTLPRHPDPDPVEQQSSREGEATDPYFDREYVATDDPAFVLSAVENARQGVIDARSAAAATGNPELRAAAEKIGAQNEATSRKLEKVASVKGWRLPQPNPARTSSVNGGRDGNGNRADTVRANANFIVHQISFHQSTMAQYRAQIAGKGDADLKRALSEALPGYQKNLERLLELKP